MLNALPSSSIVNAMNAKMIYKKSMANGRQITKTTDYNTGKRKCRVKSMQNSEEKSCTCV